jgi:hypothetical protein
LIADGIFLPGWEKNIFQRNVSFGLSHTAFVTGPKPMRLILGLPINDKDEFQFRRSLSMTEIE